MSAELFSQALEDLQYEAKSCAECGRKDRTAARPTRKRCLSCAAKFRVREYPNARFRAMPDAWKERARLLHSRGYGVCEVAQHLRDENKPVANGTVQGWLSQ